MTRHIPALLAALCAILFSACARGPAYTSAKASLVPKKGNGLVLAYWQPGLTGATAYYKVSANNQVVTPSMGRGAFASYETKPGPVVVTTKRNLDAAAVSGIFSSGGLGAGFTLYEVMREQQSAPVAVASGKTQFLRMSRGLVTMKLEPVTPEKAEREIALCRWVNPTAK